jgi:predicted nuclease of predicted toxin-antitoxin system
VPDYLDEDLPYVAGAIVGRAGIDMLTTRDAGMNGAPDEEQLRFAAAQGRCLITRNFHDFPRLSRLFEARGEPHAGVLIVPLSLPNHNPAALARAIIRYHRDHPAGVPPYLVDWLRPDQT